MQNPVGALNDLCVKRKLNAFFEFERIETISQTRCVLTVSPQTDTSESLPVQRFESNGRNKKEAKRSCSSVALDALGFEVQPTKPTLSLSETILDAFTPQVDPIPFLSDCDSRSSGGILSSMLISIWLGKTTGCQSGSLLLASRLHHGFKNRRSAVEYVK